MSDSILHDRATKAEQLEIRRQLYKSHKEQAKLYGFLRNVGGVLPLVAAGTWSLETSNLSEGQYIFGAAIVASLAAVISAEKHRRSTLNRAHEMANQVYELASKEPILATPNWVKEELNINE